MRRDMEDRKQGEEVFGGGFWGVAVEVKIGSLVEGRRKKKKHLNK